MGNINMECCSLEALQAYGQVGEFLCHQIVSNIKQWLERDYQGG